jgi:Ribonuclease G/E
MQDGNHHQSIPLFDVEDAIRKALNPDGAYVTVHPPMALGLFECARQRSLDCDPEVVAEARSA